MLKDKTYKTFEKIRCRAIDFLLIFYNEICRSIFKIHENYVVAFKITSIDAIHLELAYTILTLT